MRHPAAPALLALLVLAGCLPGSCNREEPRALLPADSLSRRLAAATPIDTLRPAWHTAAPMEHPRTVLLGPGGAVYVADTGRHSLFVFDAAQGTLQAEQPLPALRYPYLAGAAGDTVYVFSPEARRVAWVVGERVVRQVGTPAPPAGRALQYAAAGPQGVWVRAAGEDSTGFIVQLDARGRVAARRALHGPQWRYAGLLRLWGDSLLGLCGFRPVVDVLAPAGVRPDTFALAGFDSPMLARSRAFLRGAVDEAPLLLASAAPAADRLFVLNLRPGWLQVDVYDRAGRLRRVLVQPNPGYDRRYYPVDLAVRPLDARRFLIVVLVQEPQPRLEAFVWAAPPA